MGFLIGIFHDKPSIFDWDYPHGHDAMGTPWEPPHGNVRKWMKYIHPNIRFVDDSPVKLVVVMGMVEWYKNGSTMIPMVRFSTDTWTINFS